MSKTIEKIEAYKAKTIEKVMSKLKFEEGERDESEDRAKEIY